MSYDMSQVTDRLFVGANVNSVDDVADIKRAGITHVIDLNNDDEEPLFPSTGGIALLSDPTDDDGQPKPAKWFAPAIDFGVGALSHPGFKLLTHCAMGINRGPSIGFAVLRALGFPADNILDLIHRARPQTIIGVRYHQDAEAALKQLGWL